MSAARGTAALTAAEAVFVLSGWAIHVGSKHILGLELYGTLGIVLSLLTHYRVFLATGVNRAVSRFIAEEPARAWAVRRKTIRLQLALGLGLGAGVFLAAPGLARLWGDPELVGYIRLSALFLPVFGLYSVYRGTLNGFRLFMPEALVSIVYSLLKVALLFALIWKFEVYGAVTGYLLAVAAAAGLARSRCPRAEAGSDFPLSRIVLFAVPVVSFSFLISLLQSIDLYFVRACAPDPGIDTGLYTCAQQFARIPYLLIYGLGLTLFPSIAAREKDPAEAGRVLAKGLRWGLLLGLLPACLIGGAAPGLLELVYGADTASAAGSLRVLVVGQVLLAGLYLLAVALSAAGQPWRACVLAGAALAADAGLNLLLVKPLGGIGAAWATTLAAAGGLVGGALLVRARFRTLLPPLSALRIILTGAVLYGAGALAAPSGWGVIPVLAALALLGALLLKLTGEIDREDLLMLKFIFIRQK